MECSQVMTAQIAFLTPRKTLRDAATVMRDAQTGFIPICDEFKRVVGVLTDRDIVVRGIAEERSMSTSVGEVMTRDIKTCRPDDEVSHVKKVMDEEQVSRVVIVGADTHLMGVISLADLGQAAPDQAGEAQRGVKQKKGTATSNDPHDPTSPSYEAENLKLQLERAQGIDS